jgi:hypothetical protein
VNFVALGFVDQRTPQGGTLILKLGSAVFNTNTNIPTQYPDGAGSNTTDGDFILVETSYGEASKTCGPNQDQNNPEKVRVYGSTDGNEPWIELSAAECRTSFMDVAPAIRAGLPFIQYVKIVDVSDPSKFTATADGFDVDGLIVCPSEVLAALTGVNRPDGKGALRDARVATRGYEDKFFNTEPNDNGIAVEVYPNPATDHITLTSHLEQESVVPYQVLDAVGHRVLQGTLSLEAGVRETQLDISSWPKGMYLLQVGQGHTKQTTKLIKL